MSKPKVLNRKGKTMLAKLLVCAMLLFASGGSFLIGISQSGAGAMEWMGAFGALSGMFFLLAVSSLFMQQKTPLMREDMLKKLLSKAGYGDVGIITGNHVVHGSDREVPVIVEGSRRYCHDKRSKYPYQWSIEGGEAILVKDREGNLKAIHVRPETDPIKLFHFVVEKFGVEGTMTNSLGTSFSHVDYVVAMAAKKGSANA